MIYGLYLSATGVLANSFRQDVIANNLANAETVGFKRDLTQFQEMRTEARQRSLSVRQNSNALLEGLGGGLAIRPTVLDMSQGEPEATGNSLEAAIQGKGFFAVRHQGQTMLTRDGRFSADRQGYLLSNGGYEVLDNKGQPIKLDTTGSAMIGEDGTITQNGKAIARVGVFSVPNETALRKHGSGFLTYSDSKQIKPMAGSLRPKFVERSNVDPTTELVGLMDAQRQLEANANMIRFQDQTLGRLVNDVGRIG